MAKKKKGGKKKGKKEAAPPPEVCTQHVECGGVMHQLPSHTALSLQAVNTHTTPCLHLCVQPPSEFDNMDIEALKEQIADYRNKVEVAQLDRNQVQLDRVWHLQPVLLLTGHTCLLHSPPSFVGFHVVRLFICLPPLSILPGHHPNVL